MSEQRYRPASLETSVYDSKTGAVLSRTGTRERLNEQHEAIQRLTTWIPIEEFVEPEGEAKFIVLTRSNTVTTMRLNRKFSPHWEIHLNCTERKDLIAFLPAPDPDTFKPKPVAATEAELRESLKKFMTLADVLPSAGYYADLISEVQELLDR